MPRTRRKAKRKRAELLSPRTIRRLEIGFDFGLLPGDPLDEDQLREAWGQIGGEITAAHIEENPGTRPRHWWAYDAPEPRRLIGGYLHPGSGYQVHRFPEAMQGRVLAAIQALDEDAIVALARRANIQRAYYYGQPCGFFFPGRENCERLGIEYPGWPDFESETEYLHRHGLLTFEERLALEARPVGV